MWESILKMFGLTTVSHFNSGISLAIENAQRDCLHDRLKAKNKSKMLELTEHIGKPVIGINNEWCSLEVGELMRLEQFGNPESMAFPVIKNYLTGDSLINFGKTLPYSEELFDAMLKLTPYERWNICVNQARVNWNKPKKDKLYADHECLLKEKLVSLGFYKGDLKNESI